MKKKNFEAKKKEEKKPNSVGLWSSGYFVRTLRGLSEQQRRHTTECLMKKHGNGVVTFVGETLNEKKKSWKPLTGDNK